tara:strand:+ start:18 stop:248 length:231 start_codon:yes stop_codon:yes gene_type:complete
MKRSDLNFKHLKEANEGYFEHMSVAIWYAIRLGCLALRVAVHAIIPFVWHNEVDPTIRRLNQDRHDRACLRSRYLN